jgi:dolichol-phosphate mannosyltransferase
MIHADSDPRRLLSIVVPVYNERDNVERCAQSVAAALEPLADRYDYELIFTDNHSTDGTFEKLREIAAANCRVRVFRFARNHGFQKSIYTGYLLASGDAAIQLDCDLQDPPELIPQFLAKWEQGYRVVYGVRRRRREAFWMTAVRKVFYRLINWVSDDELPKDAGDFRLVDRCILDVLAQIHDCHPYLRGTIATLGFEQIGIPYARAERAAGRSKFSMSQLFGLATDGILNHSLVPLRLATYAGFVVSTLSVLTMIAYLGGRLLGNEWPAGFATLAVLILASLGITSMFLGIIGEYLGRIYQQLKGRPLTIIETAINPAWAEQPAIRPLRPMATPARYVVSKSA